MIQSILRCNPKVLRSQFNRYRIAVLARPDFWRVPTPYLRDS
jgi:hypothetical protein